MRAAGIIAEYNPLHNGHVHHIEQARNMTNCDHVIVVMSGDYVQRGEPAVADKFTRTEWALQAGADLVLELPVACALSSAERFAYGGVRTLVGTGILGALCFGSENANVPAMEYAAQMLSDETPAFKKALHEQLALGKSFPRARYDALEYCDAPREVLALLRAPNSILGIEYIRVLKQFAPQVAPIAVTRIGNSYHDTALTGRISSATAIREALQNGADEVQDTMPMYVAGRFALGAQPVTMKNLELLALYALRRMHLEDYANLPDVQEGFENVIARSARQATSLNQFFAMLKSKRYTMARCKRIALSAMLGLTKQVMGEVYEENALYLRVLGFRRQARPLLSAIRHNCTLPLVVRHADTFTLPFPAQRLLDIDRQAHSIYALAATPEAPAADFSAPLVIV